MTRNLGWILLLCLYLELVFAAKTARETFPRAGEASERAVVSIRLPDDPAAPILHPVVGRFREHSVRQGETALSLARAANTDETSLRRLNQLSNGALPRGGTVILPSVHILPMTPPEGIVLNVPARHLYVFREGSLVWHYPVAVGMRSWETPTGIYRLVRKVWNPIWIPPKLMVKREGVPAKPIGPGKDNPLGDSWMGWSRPEVGFHTSFKPESIGTMASHACVRLYPESGHRMFEQVRLGMPIYSVYETMLVGERDGSYFLSVWPDIYGMRKVTPQRVEQILKRADILHNVDRAKVRRIVARKDGYPWVIGSALPRTASLPRPTTLQ